MVSGWGPIAPPSSPLEPPMPLAPPTATRTAALYHAVFRRPCPFLEFLFLEFYFLNSTFAFQQRYSVVHEVGLETVILKRFAIFLCHSTTAPWIYYISKAFVSDFPPLEPCRMRIVCSTSAALPKRSTSNVSY